MALRYLLPTAMIGVLLFALAAASHAWVRMRVVQFVLIGVTGLLVAKAVLNDLRGHTERIVLHTSLHERIEQELLRAAGPDASPVVVYGFRAPQPSLALRTHCSDREGLRTIAQAFPREGHLDWNYRINLEGVGQDWDYLVIDEDHLARLVQPAGPVIARVEHFLIVSAPAR
jgi:hypothetical protein